MKKSTNILSKVEGIKFFSKSGADTAKHTQAPSLFKSSESEVCQIP